MTRRINVAALALAGLTLAALPVAAEAQGLRAGIARFAFNHADSNNDGRIDAAEMREVREARFAKLDADGDGIISQAELDRRIETMERRAETVGNVAEGAFDKLDSDGDGAVTRAEFVERQGSEILALVDIDGDGALSREEFGRIAQLIGAID